MARDKDIRDIVESWRARCPEKVPKAEAEKVAKHFFPESRPASKGNHGIRVLWPEGVAWKENYLDRDGIENIDFGRDSVPDWPFERGGFNLSLIKGRHVKGFYIKDLLHAIEWKEIHDELQAKKK